MEHMEVEEEEWTEEEPTQPAKNISKQQLDLLVRRLGLSKSDSAVAGSMLMEFGVLSPNTNLAFYRNRSTICRVL
jgi:hypothetical protein